MSNKNYTTILIIDDDPVVRNAIASYLSEKNFRIILSGDAKEGIESVHEQLPDLILCATALPVMDGFETIQLILKDRPDLPIIMLSNISSTEEAIKAMRLGASDYLIKPIEDMEILSLSIASVLSKAKLLSENRRYQKKLELINHELETTVEIFKQDQQAGRHVQMSMMPLSPQILSDYHFAHRIIPSLFLSGDFVDYKPISKNKVIFYIADVSGHGSSSAFITVLLRFRIEQMRREYIRSRFTGIFSPASIFTELNKDLLDSGLDKHITAFMGIIDRSKKTLAYSVAGHYPLPVMYKDGKAEFIKIKKSSFPIGLLDEAEYFEEEMKLEEDFSLTLFSDGIMEILDMKKMDDKEAYLLNAITQAKGNFNKIKVCLNLENVINVPDDIAVMSVSS